MSTNSLVIHLDGGQRRTGAQNPATMYAPNTQPRPPIPFRNWFLRHYASIRATCIEFARPGLAIFAVDERTEELAGRLCLSAHTERANAAIVGRHSMADLYLDGDLNLSLRQLIVIVAPLAPEQAAVRFRLIDLRTTTGFEDERGQRYDALVSEGPLFVRCGSFALLLFITGDESVWPEAAEDGWSCMPERVYLDKVVDSPHASRWERRHRRRSLGTRPDISGASQLSSSDSGRESQSQLQSSSRPSSSSCVTRVLMVQGIVSPGSRLLAPGEQPVGTLRIGSCVSEQRLQVGPAALRQGILLGRYDRCDIDGSSLLDDHHVSRIHLIVIAIDDRIYAIDAASTNGTWMQNERGVRLAPIDNGTELFLGNHLITVSWHPIS